MSKIDFKELIDGFVDNIKDELKNVIEESKKDTCEFIQKKGDDLERYLKELASGEITEKEFGDLLKGLISINKIQYRKLSAQAKVRAQEIINRVGELVIDSLFKLIKV